MMWSVDSPVYVLERRECRRKRFLYSKMYDLSTMSIVGFAMTIRHEQTCRRPIQTLRKLQYTLLYIKERNRAHIYDGQVDGARVLEVWGT